jgi:2-C-methyl-D-erythritol 4-phosphate cytidylyltransferase
MRDTTTREGAATSGSLALIAAGGEGRRLGSIGPKALVLCAGRPLLAWCLDAFVESAAFGSGGGSVVVAAHASQLDEFEAACGPAREQGLDVLVTEGGPSRSHSVAAALRAGEARAGRAERVLVQDAARIFTTGELIDGMIAALDEADSDLQGLVAAAPVVNTIKLVDENDIVESTPPRERLWAVQTPQLFCRDALAGVLGVDAQVEDAVLAAASDDASLIEAAGGRIGIHRWSEFNGKVTTPEDLQQAERRLSPAGV